MRRVGIVLALVGLIAGSAGCSSDAPASVAPTGPSTSVIPTHLSECPENPTPPLMVDQIAPAIAAVEAKLGGPQQYFEINAADVVVNLFVVSNGEGTAPSNVTPYAFAKGQLTAGGVLQGNGVSFTADKVVFEPKRVLSCVAAELPASKPEVFSVVADEAGATHLSVTVVSPQGGRLAIDVDGKGRVLSVDPQ
ncbi:MAG: hypothetical protein WCO88_10665 [Actinomycetota bacterium]